MNRNQSLIAALAIGGACVFATMPARATLVFSDDFDSDAVGSFPATWTAITALPSGVYVTNGRASLCWRAT